MLALIKENRDSKAVIAFFLFGNWIMTLERARLTWFTVPLCDFSSNYLAQWWWIFDDMPWHFEWHASIYQYLMMNAIVQDGLDWGTTTDYFSFVCWYVCETQQQNQVRHFPNFGGAQKVINDLAEEKIIVNHGNCLGLQLCSSWNWTTKYSFTDEVLLAHLCWRSQSSGPFPTSPAHNFGWWY